MAAFLMAFYMPDKALMPPSGNVSELIFINLFVVISPVRGGTMRAVIAILAAIGVPAWQATPGWAVDIHFLIFITG